MVNEKLPGIHGICRIKMRTGHDKIEQASKMKAIDISTTKTALHFTDKVFFHRDSATYRQHEKKNYWFGEMTRFLHTTQPIVPERVCRV